MLSTKLSNNPQSPNYQPPTPEHDNKAAWSHKSIRTYFPQAQTPNHNKTSEWVSPTFFVSTRMMSPYKHTKNSF